MTANRYIVRMLWIAIIFLAFIGLAVATRRTLALLSPATVSVRNNPAAALDAHFANQRTLTLTHVLPAMLFMLLGPLQFVRALRAKHPRLHRWCMPERFGQREQEEAAEKSDGGFLIDAASRSDSPSPASGPSWALSLQPR